MCCKVASISALCSLALTSIVLSCSVSAEETVFRHPYPTATSAESAARTRPTRQSGRLGRHLSTSSGSTTRSTQWLLSFGNWSNSSGWTCGCVPNNGTFDYTVVNNVGTVFEDLPGIVIDSYTSNNAAQLFVVSGASLYLASGTSNDYGGVIVAEGNLSAFNDNIGHVGTIVNWSGAYLGTSSTGHLINNSGVDNQLGTIQNDGFLGNFASFGFTPIINNYSYYSPTQNLGGLINNGWIRNAGTINNTTPSGCEVSCEAEINSNSGSLFENGYYNGQANVSGTVNNNVFSIFNDNPGAILNNNLYSTINNYGIFTNNGQLNNSGVVNNSGLFSSAGTVTQLYQLAVMNNSGQWNNYEAFNLDAGMFENGGRFFNNGSLQISYATFDNVGTSALFVNLGGVRAVVNIDYNGALTNSSGATFSNTGLTTLNNNIGGLLANFSGATLINDPAAILNNGGSLFNAGMFSNSGTLSNTYYSSTISNYGTVDNNTGGILSNYSFATINNNSGGTLNNNVGATLNNYSGAIFNNCGAFNNYGIFNNYGTYNNCGTHAEFGTSNNFGIVSSTGTYTVTASGAATNLSGATMSLAQIGVAGTLKNDGTLIMAGASPLTIMAGGMLSGIGTVVGNVANSGTLSPGDSPGVFTINGNYTQTSTGVFLLELGGASLGQYDQLFVSGTAKLDGTLDIELIDGFVPHGQTFVFLESGDLLGVFSRVDFLNCPYCSDQLSYNGTSISLVASTPEPSALILTGTGVIGFCLGYSRRRAKIYNNGTYRKGIAI